MPIPTSDAAIAPDNAGAVAEVGIYDETYAYEFDWSPDGSVVAIGGSVFYLYDVAAKTSDRASTDTMGPARFTPDGATLLASDYSAITLWDVASVTRLSALPDSNNAQAFAISPDGATLVAAIGDALRFWDLPSGVVLSTVPAVGDSISTLAFSPDGRTLAAGGGKLTLRDPNTGLVQNTITGQTYVRSLAFSPDGLVLAAASSDGVRLWNLETGRPQGLRADQAVEIKSIAFSPGGLLLATGGADQVVRLWEVATGNELASLTGHTSEVSRVAFSPDGAILASGGGDGLRLWSVAR
jgi:WD40 repeat protein